MTMEEASWIPTLFALGCALGFGFGGWVSDARGKKVTMLASNLAAYVCWVVTASAGNKWLLFGSYSLQGFFGAIAYNCIGVFIAETAHASFRRILGPFQTITACLGCALGYTSGALLSWRTSKLVLGTLITIPAAFAILLCQETPHWLVKRGMTDEARKSMDFYRGKDYQQQEDELNEIMEQAQSKDVPNNISCHFQVLTSRHFLRPFLCLGVIYTLFQLSGFFVISTYAHIFLEAASGHSMTHLPPEKLAIILGVFKLAASLLVPLIFAKAPKKMIFIVSGSLASLSLATVAIFNHIVVLVPTATRYYILDTFHWIPILATILPIVCQVIGITPTLHVLCGESFPTEISTTANGIIFALQYNAQMVNVKLFPTAVASVGFHSVVYFYAAVAAVLTTWGLLTIKDTDKLSLTEIQSMYSGTGIGNTENKEETPLLEQIPAKTKLRTVDCAEGKS